MVERTQDLLPERLNNSKRSTLLRGRSERLPEKEARMSLLMLLPSTDQRKGRNMANAGKQGRICTGALFLPVVFERAKTRK